MALCWDCKTHTSRFETSSAKQAAKGQKVISKRALILVQLDSTLLTAKYNNNIEDK